jgi:hypothetical protein
VVALVGCGTLSILGVLLIGALVVGANVGVQKAKEQAQTTGDKGETKNAPSKEKADSVEFLPVVLRVSGDEGTGYRCTFATQVEEEGEVVSYTSNEQGTLGTTPVDYAAQIVGENSNRPPSPFNASCTMIGPYSGGKSKDQPKVLSGRLKAEVLVNDAVKDEDETRPDPANKTSQQSMAVEVNYYPPCDGPMPKDKTKAKGKGKGC